jgi:single-stranded-DNA-specific exonuclease
MNALRDRFQEFEKSLEQTKDFLFKNLKDLKSIVEVYTHLDADGLCSGAIIGKMLYREKVPFQIRVLKQLEREEIIQIAERLKAQRNFVIFTDFGSGQYLELLDKLMFSGNITPCLVLDHHLPQDISDKQDHRLSKLKDQTSPWHVNPYFYGIDGSNEISAAGICYTLSKLINIDNKDLSIIALIGATGDIQNQGSNNSFTGINEYILNDALEVDLIEVVNDLNFSSIKPLHDAIAYSSKINLPGLTGNTSTSLKFLKSSGILIERVDGTIRTLNDLTQDEKKKLSDSIIQYATLNLNMDHNLITKNLVINRYVLKNEIVESELHDLAEFSNLLNACGRSDNGSLGIAIAMGDRKFAYQKGREQLINHRKIISKALGWLNENQIVKQKENIQYFFGENIISDTMIGTIASILSHDKGDLIDRTKPIFGCAIREKQGVFKVSARADESLLEKGLNLSEAIREALRMSDLEVLGGGHPPAAGTIVPSDKIDLFLDNVDKVIKKQLTP